MSNLIIDVPLLICPNPGQLPLDKFRDAFIEFLGRLEDIWRLRAGYRSVRFWSDSELPSILAELDCYPFRHVLAQAFDHLPYPAEFQLEDVNVLATSLIERSLRLEDHGEMTDAIVASCSIENDPYPERPERLASYLCKLLTLSLPLLGDDQEFQPRTFLVSTYLDGTPSKTVAKFFLELVESNDGSVKDVGKPVRVEITNYLGALSFFGLSDLVAWWRMGDELSMIDVCSAKAAVDCGDPWAAVERTQALLSFGAEFMSSARSLGFMRDETKVNKLLRVVCDLINDRDAAAGHWLRTGKGANDPQVGRGKWRAWRHDIDDEFHLHYWRWGKRLELANVVVHNDFHISA